MSHVFEFSVSDATSVVKKPVLSDAEKAKILDVSLDELSQKNKKERMQKKLEKRQKESKDKKDQRSKRDEKGNRKDTKDRKKDNKDNRKDTKRGKDSEKKLKSSYKIDFPEEVLRKILIEAGLEEKGLKGFKLSLRAVPKHD